MRPAPAGRTVRCDRSCGELPVGRHPGEALDDVDVSQARRDAEVPPGMEGTTLSRSGDAAGRDGQVTVLAYKAIDEPIQVDGFGSGTRSTSSVARTKPCAATARPPIRTNSM